MSSINKDLAPLVKEDADFAEAAPNLFGADLSKRAKEHLDQVTTPHDMGEITAGDRFSGRASPQGGERPKEGVEPPATKGATERDASVSHRPSHACMLFIQQ